MHRDVEIPPAPLLRSTSSFAGIPICLPVYIFVTSQVFQNVGVTNADAVYVRQHCPYLVLGAVGCSSLYGLSGFLFRLGVALLPCELSRVHELYISRDLLTLPLLVQWS